MKLALLLLSLATAHAGHDEEVEWCVAPAEAELICPLAAVELPDRGAERLARQLLARGEAALAARIIARQTAAGGEAALLLAEALEALGDRPGAALARARARASLLP